MKRPTPTAPQLPANLEEADVLSLAADVPLQAVQLADVDATGIKAGLCRGTR